MRNRALDRAYELKEYLATILGQATPGDAPELLEEWLEWAARSRLAPFVKLGRTIRKHAEGIPAYLDTRMTNGPVEGINNKLRVIARRAYGFHSAGALISMLFLCCGGIELAPPLPHAFEEIRKYLLLRGRIGRSNKASCSWSIIVRLSLLRQPWRVAAAADPAPKASRPTSGRRTPGPRASFASRPIA